MRIIDDKGRLFGKINVIDFLAILFLLCIIPVAYLGYKVFKRPLPEPEKITSIFTSVDVYTIFKDLTPEVAGLISIGDKEMNSAGNLVGEILDILKVESNFMNIKLSQSDIITKEDISKKQVTAKLRLMGRLEHDEMLYKGNRVKFGSEIVLKTTEYTVRGTIIPEPIQFTQSYKSGLTPITIDILFKNLSPEVVNLISVGDFEIDKDDKDGDTIAKVLSIGTPEPYTYMIDLGGGNYITNTDPQKKQLQAKLEIMGGIEGNAFYFRGKRIALDSGVEFNTNKYRIEGVVVREPIAVKKIDKKWLLLKVRFSNLIPELADVIKEGDEQIDNISGDLIAKIIKIESIENNASIGPSEIRIQNDIKLIVDNSPLNKDIVLLIKLLCIKTQRGPFFIDTSVKIGNTIFLEIDKYNISGKIIDIEEINGEIF